MYKRQPFQFFTSHTDEEVGAATSAGRLEEFSRQGWGESVVPDPQDPATYQRSKLDWSEAGTPRGARMLAVYRRLAELRRTLPDLTRPEYATCTADEEARVFTMERGRLTVVVNFGDEPCVVDLEANAVLFETESGVDLVEGALTLPAHAGALLTSAS